MVGVFGSRPFFLSYFYLNGNFSLAQIGVSDGIVYAVEIEMDPSCAVFQKIAYMFVSELRITHSD
jgi:hypothetical protein